MTTQPQRLQYLEAMGLTAWVARYRLPHARPTDACEWELPERPASKPPAERLHALLDEAEAASARQPAPDPVVPETPRPAAPGRARQLLGGEPKGEVAESPDNANGVADEAIAPQEPLRFALQVACLGDRWLLVVPATSPPDATQLQLLGNALQAVGIVPGRLPVFETFRWPLIEAPSVSSPLEEAREGLHAYIDGARRRGWAPERVLIFGHEETVERVLAIERDYCEALALPGWQGPGLDELARSADAKRSLWPVLRGWAQAWSRDAEAGADG
ncbi:hypothetical protein [Billgrantia saliphila]|uniref:hypothetical protein n=1 Tax=Billgrantia saliphila TaxID=1848458 RepID=UPI001E2FB098|nr:hypothetical protein [Halomonas saliphila]